MLNPVGGPAHGPLPQSVFRVGVRLYPPGLEHGVAAPQRGDFIQILHPEMKGLAPLRYYKKIE